MALDQQPSPSGCRRTLGGDVDAGAGVAVASISARSWRKDVKWRDIRALKVAKETVGPVVITGAAAGVADLVKLLLGGAPGFTVSTVAVGHSRRSDSFSVRLAAAAAAELELPFAKIFVDRPSTVCRTPRG